ncbi:multidrug transporter EmrE-like cation transporter [Chitinivorax tropicus]|uniref:Multidrug transporter EmrE-like cation transporter n=1 Tax=Chitinivorax tropicus TaxID=714531 RepID=A0A840MJI9_9PROT|nr:EamA family transporter [Chitinivorax tropicus]MBB5017665.1 multidrug transporter EmrE-like cation transporter [Chitinivorax tropicus]
MNTFLIALVSIALSVTAQFSLKTGMSSPGIKALLVQPRSLKTWLMVLSNQYVLGGFLLYALGAVVWLNVLAKWDVSKAYPLVGLGFVVTAVVGYWLGEQMTWPRMAGIALICAGIVLIGRS